MRAWQFKTLLLFVVCFGQPQSTFAADVADFMDYTLYSSRGTVELLGRLFIPPQTAADPTTPRPLMVYLHGGGAAGSDNITQIVQTPDPLVDEARSRGAYLYVPQVSSTWASESAVDSVMTMINRAIAERNIDPDRLYATGYSNGGGGVWNLLSRNPKRFAAAFTVNSIAPLASFNPANLLGTAIFTLHARDDTTVPIARTRTVVNGILAAAGSTLPNYAALPADQNLLVANPAFQFDRDLMNAQPTGTVFHSITVPNLELIYADAWTGGHTGLLSLFYAPPLYDWIYSHSLAAPEPAGPFLLLCGLSLIAVAARPTRVAI
jgi:predicted esterase